MTIARTSDFVLIKRLATDPAIFRTSPTTLA